MVSKISKTAEINSDLMNVEMNEELMMCEGRRNSARRQGGKISERDYKEGEGEGGWDGMLAVLE